MAIQQLRPVAAVESRPASLVSYEQLAELVNAAFDGHMGGRVPFTAKTIARWAEIHFISLNQSLVFHVPSETQRPVAFAFIALRDDEGDCAGREKDRHARLAGMGVVPEFQSRKVGGLALRMVIEKMRDKGMEVLELECDCKNERGLRLYRSAGFQIIRKLSGWEREDEVTLEDQRNEDRKKKKLNGEKCEGEDIFPGSEVRERLQECPIQEVSDLVTEHAAENLPWQAWGFHRSMMPQRAFHVNREAYCVVAMPQEGEPGYRISCVFVRPECRGKGASLRLARTMFAHFPQWRWHTRVVFPTEYGEKIAARTGFTLKEERQYQMRLRIQQ